MSKKILIAITIFIIVLLILLSKVAYAAMNTSKVKVSVYTEQGDEWFKIIKKKTSFYGRLTFDKLLPGKYKLVIDEDGRQENQLVNLRAQMYDENGRAFNEKVDVEVYAYLDSAALPNIVAGNDKTFIEEVRTNRDGLLKLINLTPGIEYRFDVDDDANLDEDDYPRIITKAQIEDSDWFDFDINYTDSKMTLYLKDMISGKYKFKYEDGDVEDPSQTFNLHLRFLDDNKERIKKTKDIVTVKVKTYTKEGKVTLGEYKTDRWGNLYLYDIIPGNEYTFEVQ